METSSTVSRFPAPDTGQALSKYLREEGFLELSHAGVAVQRGPQGRGARAAAGVCEWGVIRNAGGKRMASACRTLKILARSLNSYSRRPIPHSPTHTSGSLLQSCQTTFHS